MKQKIRTFITAQKNNIKVGFFLAKSDLKRSSKWTTILIIFIMTITFLNLVVVRGILVGLIVGAFKANKQYYTGNVIIIAPKDKTDIQNTPKIIDVMESIPAIDKYSVRYLTQGRLEAGYKDKIRASDKPESIGANVSGIDPQKEDAVSQIASRLLKGSYLEENELDTILVGSSLLAAYTATDGIGAQTLRSADVGTKVRLTINNNTREVTIKGIYKTKSGQIDTRVLINEKQLRQMIGKSDFNANEIAMTLFKGESDVKVKNILLANDVKETADVKTEVEGRPSAVKDIEDTFNILGNVIGSIGLAVATISIFIVIFVNAITRRKYIGILKGIGVTEEAIEYSYMIQSFFYALCGIIIASVLTFTLLLPYFDNNPINFPFSDGVLVASFSDVLNRGLVLLAATIFAGYFPARIVVKQHTLDAILGR